MLDYVGSEGEKKKNEKKNCILFSLDFTYAKTTLSVSSSRFSNVDLCSVLLFRLIFIINFSWNESERKRRKNKVSTSTVWLKRIGIFCMVAFQCEKNHFWNDDFLQRKRIVRRGNSDWSTTASDLDDHGSHHSWSSSIGNFSGISLGCFFSFRSRPINLWKCNFLFIVVDSFTRKWESSWNCEKKEK